MNRLLLCTALTLATLGCAIPAQTVAADSQRKSIPSKKTMQAFKSEAELRLYFSEFNKNQRARQQGMAFNAAAPATPAPAKAAAEATDSVTNVQTAGVDEGGIVKVHGNHLVMLRRGRLFTVAIGDKALEPVAMLDAYAPDMDPSGAWYDEMLISGDTIAVIGYSYQRGGTEVNLFNIDQFGGLTYKSTYHLRSNDYYSSRNYASRLIGTKLIFYSPLYYYGGGDPLASFPAIRKWHKNAGNGEFRPILAPTNVYHPERPITGGYSLALHTVTTCDLARGEFDCTATSVVGPPGRVFYVSADSVYVWMTEWNGWDKSASGHSMLYRMPLDGAAPSALNVAGSPVDQFSFLESDDHHLNVLVRSDGRGDGMWRAEHGAGDIALMRIPLSSFGDGSGTVPESRYRNLPRPAGYTLQNRFVGAYLLYGAGSGWGYPQKTSSGRIYVVRWANGDEHELILNHSVDRIEQLGRDAIIVGASGNDLHFTSVRLNRHPEAADEYVREAASQGELRSHGFFYKPDGPDTGILGLPISTPGRPGYKNLREGSAGILFLRNKSLHFEEVGELSAESTRVSDDNCHASCVDWYGNARPLFVRGRVIALLGYELVEGSLDRGKFEELRRVSYAPNRENAIKR